MAIGSKRPFRPNSAARNRAAKAKMLLCAVALGLGAVGYAQPFPSFLLDTTRFIGRGLCVIPSCVAVAASRTGGMVAWPCSNYHICASRLTEAMAPVDTIPLDVTGPLIRANVGAVPAVACSDSGYAVAWHGGGGSMEYVWLAPTSRSGDIKTRVIVDSQVQVNSLSMAARRGRYALISTVWCPSAQRYEVRATEVTPSGAVLRRLLVVHGDPANPFVDAADVAPGDSAYLAVWQGPDSTEESGNIVGRFIWPDSASADTLAIPIRQGSAAFDPKVAFDGRNFWVVWLEEIAPNSETVAKAARVSQSGVVLDTGGFVVARGAAHIDLAAAGETTLVACEVGTNSVACTRLDPDGQALDSIPVVLTSRAQGPPAVAVATDTFLVLWDERVDSVSLDRQRLAGRRLTASGGVIDSSPQDYAFSANSHGGATMASDGESFLAVWTDLRADPFYSVRFRGRRFDNQGGFLDAEPFTVGGPHILPLRSVLTYGAGCYLLCWSEDPDGGATTTYATRISRDGQIMDTIPIPLCHTSHFTEQLAAAPIGDSTFAVALSYDSAGGDSSAGAGFVRVTSGGRVLDSVPIAVRVRSGASIQNERVSLAGAGDTLVAACLIHYYAVDSVYVGVGLFDRTLTKVDSVWWRPPRGHRRFATDVAFGASRILAADLDDAYAPCLWLLDSAANLLDTSPTPIPGGLAFYDYTDFAYDGANFLCVNAKTAGRYQTLGGFRLSPNGDLLDPSTVDLVAFESTHVTDNCALAADSQGHVGLAFFSFEPVGCMSSRARATVFPRLTSGVVSGRAVGDLNRLQVSPNPSTGITWVQLAGSPGEFQTLSVRDIAGRVRTEISLMSAPTKNGCVKLDLRRLPTGVYFLEAACGRTSCKLVLTMAGGAP